MAQMAMSAAQIEEIARQVLIEEREWLRQELLQEVAAQSSLRSEEEEQA